jgi:hypothetical protein
LTAVALGFAPYTVFSCAAGILADRRPPTADRRPPTADRRPPTADHDRRCCAP